MDIGALFTEVAFPSSSRTNKNSYAQAIQKTEAAEKLASKTAQGSSPFDTPAYTVTVSSKAEDYSNAYQTLSSFPPEVVAEAQRRFDNGVETEYLPMTKENKALYDEITKEINACKTDSERAALSPIREGLLRNGWKESMTREQAKFEAQVYSAKSALETLAGHSDAYNEGLNRAVMSANPNNLIDVMDKFEREWAASSPAPARYADKGLTMPKTPYYKLPDMAKAAGIGDEEFASTAREYAKTMNDPDLYYALEEFISARYSGKSA